MACRAAVAATRCGVHRSTVYRLWRRYRQGGWQALRERRPVPRRQPRRLSQAAEQTVIAARKATGMGPQRLGALVGMPASTVGKVLARHGLSRPPRARGRAGRRYERAEPGELLHVDTKQLGRFHQPGKRILRDGVHRSRNAGWQHLHVAIDDHTRLAYCEVLRTNGHRDACAFLVRAVAWFAGAGIRIQEVMSDNGSAYRSQPWARLCTSLGLRRIYTRPYTPRTNGKAERFVQTALREWAYRYAYPTSAHRTRALSGWVRWYNRRRPHGSLAGQPPVSRVAQLRGQYS